MQVESKCHSEFALNSYHRYIGFDTGLLNGYKKLDLEYVQNVNG